MGLYNAVLASQCGHIDQISGKFLHNFEELFCMDTKQSNNRDMAAKFSRIHNIIPNNPYIFRTLGSNYNSNQIQEV